MNKPLEYTFEVQCKTDVSPWGLWHWQIRRTSTVDILSGLNPGEDVNYGEGLAQLNALADHHREHRLLEGVPEAMQPGSTLREAAPWA